MTRYRKFKATIGLVLLSVLGVTTLLNLGAQDRIDRCHFSIMGAMNSIPESDRQLIRTTADFKKLLDPRLAQVKKEDPCRLLDVKVSSIEFNKSKTRLQMIVSVSNQMSNFELSVGPPNY